MSKRLREDGSVWLYDDEDCEDDAFTEEDLQDGLAQLITGDWTYGSEICWENMRVESHSISVLKDKKLIVDAFIAQIGESYRAAFQASGAVLISRLKTNGKLTSDVYSWANKVGEIRRTINRFLREKYCGEAKNKVKTMPEAQLRDRVIQLLEENPDLYTLFIN